MLRGSLKSWSGFALITALGACSNIIGLSEIDIDPALDATGGKSAGGDAGAPDGGVPSEGGKNTGGDAGAGGEPPSGCQSASECDDDVECTVDNCGKDGECVHTADDTLCTAAAGMCSTCKVGIGCVDSAPVVKELLLDGNFDERTGDWVEYSTTFDDKNIFADPAAQSGGYSVKLGPATIDATEQEFADLNQQLTVPAKTVKLSVSGYYKVAPGTKMPADDYTTLTLFSLEQPPDAAHDDTWYIRYVDYHSFDGNDPKQEEWTAFSYDTTKAVVTKVAGQDVTLDLVCETWDTVYYFDSLSLKASVCE